MASTGNEDMAPPRKSPMKCSVMRSGLKDFTYIYLRTGHDFDDLPAELKQLWRDCCLNSNELRQLSPEISMFENCLKCSAKS